MHVVANAANHAADWENNDAVAYLDRSVIPWIYQCGMHYKHAEYGKIISSYVRKYLTF